MTDRGLVKKALKKYRNDSGFYILQKSAVYIKGSGGIWGRAKTSKRIYSAIDEFLNEKGFSCSVGEIGRQVSRINAPPLDDRELFLFYYCICKALFIKLLEIDRIGGEHNGSSTGQRADNLHASIFKILYELEDFSFDSFYQNSSTVHRILTKNNPDHYRISDSETQRHGARYVYRYAKKHKISEVEAAKIYRGDLSKPKPHSRLYLPFLSILSLLSAFFIALSCGVVPGILSILPIFEFFRIISVLILSKLCIPSRIPSLDITSIPDSGRTIGVITTLVDKSNIKELIKKIEDYHNRNKDPNLCIGILADLADSGDYYTNEDENHVKRLIDEFNRLNKRYGGAFCLFIRQRSYIATEGRYAGKERKRGAVLALCSLLTGNENSFETVICPQSFLKSTAYLITLDSDTEIGMGDVRAMTAAMLHPNNRPIIKDGRVIKGHALLQPKIVPSLKSSSGTPFSLTVSGVGGHDGYRGVDFELYQTLFDRSTFCGKGIIDVGAFYSLFANSSAVSFKEESILSHDTPEGGYGRCGYLSNVTLTDACPQNPLSFYKRYHRWLRGDTQNLPFLFGKITNGNNERVKNPLDPLGKIMVLDNFLRALLPISIFLLLVFAFFAPFKVSALLTALAILPIVTPFIISVSSLGIYSPFKFYSNTVKSFCREFCLMLFELSAIPSKAIISADAVLRALWRMTVSKKHLMQWVTAEAGERVSGRLTKYFVKFLPSLILGILILLLGKNQFFDFFSVLWIMFFLICYAMGSEYPKSSKISKRQKQLLEKYCLDSWYYFAHLVNADTNHLPPDNYQISPMKKVAMRTSPTNVGLYLLTCGAAHKFGFITTDELKERISSTIKTIEKLPKYRGHLYNWYDIKTLKVLGTPYVSTVDSGNLLACLYSLIGILSNIGSGISFDEEIKALYNVCESMPLGFLFNKKRGLFAIGIDTATEELGDNCYDILMSEVRTAVYIAVCRHEVNPEVYYKMSCPIIKRSGHMGIASWSGTAFEYFMPSIFLPIYNNSLSYESLGFAFFEQLKDKTRGVWGRSESGYFAFDHEMNYQYRAFGTPSLAIDPEIAKHNVIAPYSSFLALCVSYKQPCANLLRLEKLGAYGKYGFYEAIDFTGERVGEGMAVIYSWMSHHLAMSILSACNACFDGYIVNSFMANPVMRCGSVLLQRKIPVDIKLSREMQKRDEPMEKTRKYSIYRGGEESDGRGGSLPKSSCYSNSIMGFTALSNGQICFRYKNNALSYPFFDKDNLRGVNLRVKIKNRVIDPLSDGSFSRYLTGVCYHKQEDGTDLTTSISLHGEYNAACINLTAKGDFDEVCSLLMLEPILDTVGTFSAHPAFSGLNVSCRYDSQSGLLIYERKKRENPHEATYLALGIGGGGSFSFISRKEDAFDMLYDQNDIDKLTVSEFNNRDGACINPIAIIKTSSVINQKNKREDRNIYSIDFMIYAAESLNEIYKIQNKLRHDKNVHTVGYTGAFSKSLERIAREQLTISQADREVIELCSVLRSSFLTNPYRIKNDDRLSHTHLLYKHGISNDFQIVCLNLTDTPDSHMMNAVELFSRANRYMRCISEPFDLVVISPNEKEGNSYFAPNHSMLKNALEKWTGAFALNQRGGIYLINRGADGEDGGGIEEICALSAFCFEINKNCVTAELIKKAEGEYRNNRRDIIRKIGNRKPNQTKGRFLKDSFVIEKGWSKRPWSYTYSSRFFGTLLTDNSLGFTWFGNSKESRLTPWSNDPLLDMEGEMLVMKIDDKEYDLAAISHQVEFGRGHGIYKGSLGGIDYTVTVGISIKLPFKYIVFSAVNQSPAKIKFTVYLKLTPSLGSGRGCSYKVSSSDGISVYTNKNSANMGNFSLFATDKRHNFALDCGQSANANFILGAVNRKNDKAFYKILALTEKKDFFTGLAAEYSRYFDEITSVFSLDSPFVELDCMFNYYSPYQACCQRIFARSGFYQSGGAYGYRDQLQDALSLVYMKPDILKNQILRCASRQFIKGDVLHWWHERAFGDFEIFGVRTKCSDDYLWLPFATAVYVMATGDKDILDYSVGYISGDELRENEKERCMTVFGSKKKERLYYHCIRAIHLALSRRDEKGLCLIGSCDWNDGFSNVGNDEAGTSTWLTRFLQLTLSLFNEICQTGDKNHDRRLFSNEYTALDNAIEAYGFNGEYYIRGTFADGSPLGDRECSECKIDVLPQAFSAMVKGNNERTKSSMSRAIDLLFDKDYKILKLFSPPFEHSEKSPGYIMAYVPGTRENGGQYTHGALWGALGCLRMNERKYYQTAFDILQGCNPAYRCSHPKLNKSYGAEPYAFAGDIYTNEAHYGRGGWSQYTGAAGWFFTIVLSELLGYREHMGRYFTVSPKLCKSFNKFTLKVNKKMTEYIITAELGEKNEYLLDGVAVDNHFIFDEKKHFLKITVAKM